MQLGMFKKEHIRITRPKRTDQCIILDKEDNIVSTEDWKVEMKTSTGLIHPKIDTGADVTVIGETHPARGTHPTRYQKERN